METKAERLKFTELIVWQKAHQVFLDIANDVDSFPKKKTADIIISQLIRSCSSISANIAEGNARHRGKEYEHYLIIARGSLAETENWLIKCRDLGYMEDTVFEKRMAILTEVLKMLNKMIGQLRKA
ncbi:MAG: four helix bundle protein [Deltaproteobacteria bacterium]|nr:four helix bundle protein [Deltaproteobacteria bacterium]